jgi:hypothetical protein
MDTNLFIKVIQKIVKDETQKVVHDELQKLVPAIAQAIKAQLQVTNVSNIENHASKAMSPKNKKAMSNEALEHFLNGDTSNTSSLTNILEQTKSELTPNDPILSDDNTEDLEALAPIPVTPTAKKVQNTIMKDYGSLMEAYNKKGLK